MKIPPKTRKTLASVLIVFMVLIGLPGAFLIKPQKADAFADCILNALGLLGGVNSIVSAIFAVPVSNIGIETSSGMTAGNTTAQTLKDCVLDSIVNVMVNTLIQQATDSVVNWINSDFEGSPSFVSDTEGFFADYVDITAGKMIEELGPVGQVLCSPFDLQIRLSLGFGFSANYYREIGCRLSDVQKNIYNAFVGGKWGAGGWSDWISISYPSNNPYGAYINANDAISQKILQGAGLKQTELSWGRGFLGQMKCKKYDNGKCIDPGYTKTPGAVIESQLNQALGSGTRRIEVADEINEVLTALMAYGMRQMMGGSGLLGRGYTRNGSSYVGQVVNSYQNQIASAKAVPPKGIKCDYGGRNYLVEQGTWSGLDTTTDNDVAFNNVLVRIWQPTYKFVSGKPNIADSCVVSTPAGSGEGCWAIIPSGVGSKVAGPSERLINGVFIPGDRNGLIGEALKEKIQQEITDGCFNDSMNAVAQNEFGQLPPGMIVGGEGGTTPGTNPQEKNLILRKEVAFLEGEMWGDESGKYKLGAINDGVTERYSGAYIGFTSTEKSVLLQIELDKPSKINYLKIQTAESGTGINYDYQYRKNPGKNPNGDIIKGISLLKIEFYKDDPLGSASPVPTKTITLPEKNTSIKKRISTEPLYTGMPLFVGSIATGGINEIATSLNQITPFDDLGDIKYIRISRLKKTGTAFERVGFELDELEVYGTDEEATGATGPNQEFLMTRTTTNTPTAMSQNLTNAVYSFSISSSLASKNLPDMTFDVSLAKLQADGTYKQTGVSTQKIIDIKVDKANDENFVSSQNVIDLKGTSGLSGANTETKTYTINPGTSGLFLKHTFTLASGAEYASGSYQITTNIKTTIDGVQKIIGTQVHTFQIR